MDSPRRQRSISLCQPHSTTPHPSRVGEPTRLPDALGCRPSTAGGQGATLSTFPLVPLTPEPTCTQAIDPGTSASTLTPADTSRPSRSSGDLPDFLWPGSPWLAHGSPLHGDWSPNPTGLLLGAFGLPSHPMSHSSMPHPVTGPFSASCGLPTPSGCCAAPSHPPSRVYTPPGRQQPCGAGPLDSCLSGDRFVRLARVAPFPPPPLSPVQCPRPITRFPRRPRPLGPSCGSSHTPLSVLSPFPCIPVSFPGRLQPSGAGPADPLPSRDRFACLALVAPFPPPSACEVCSLQDLWWVPLPGPRAPHYPCLSRTWSPVAVVIVLCCLYIYLRHPRSLVCPFAPSRSSAARSLCAARPPEALWGFVRVFWFFFPPCFLPCGSLLPACTHNNTAQPSVSAPSRCSCPVPSPSCGVALGGPRPCQVGAPPPRPTHLSLSMMLIFFIPSPPSPPLCLLPTLLLLFSSSVCSPPVVPAPWLYPARSHAHQGLSSVLRPVCRLGRPPQIPLQGDSPMVLPRRPPLHQFPDGRAGRPVRLNAGHWHGVSLCETRCSFAPLLAPFFPPLPRPAPSVCPSLVSCQPLLFFFMSPWLRSPLLPHALRVPAVLLRATPVSPPRAP